MKNRIGRAKFHQFLPKISQEVDVCCLQCSLVINQDDIAEHQMSTLCSEHGPRRNLTAVTKCPVCQSSCGRVQSLFYHFIQSHMNEVDTTLQAFDNCDDVRKSILEYNDSTGYRMIVNIPLKKTKLVPFMHYVCNRASNRCSNKGSPGKRSADSRVVRLSTGCPAIALLANFDDKWHLILHKKHNHEPIPKPESRSFVNAQTGKRQKRYATVTINPYNPVLASMVDPDYKLRMTEADAQIVDDILSLQMTPAHYATYATKLKGQPISRTTVTNILSQAFSQRKQVQSSHIFDNDFGIIKNHDIQPNQAQKCIPIETTFQLEPVSDRGDITNIAPFDEDEASASDQLTTVCALLAGEESVETNSELKSILADARHLVEKVINQRSQSTRLYAPPEQFTVYVERTKELYYNHSGQPLN